MRDVDARMPGISCRLLDGQDVIFRVRIPVENDVVPNLGNIERPVHFGFAVARY